MLSFHPLADIFPLLEGEEFDALVEDIRQHGLREPIVLYHDQILDGRNRYRACMAAGRADCRFERYQGDDPLAFVISLNLKRRHLSESQRAMVAAKLATLKLGDNQHSEGLPIGRGSELLNVGERSVARAREVQQQGAPELIHAVESDKVSVSAAADIATLPVEQQRAILANFDKREILRAAIDIRAQKAEARRIEQHAKLAALSNATTAWPTGQRFPIIYADPPYRYENERSISRAPENHYPTVPAEEICALPVSDLATPDAVLFLWTPAPILLEALDIMRAWGFEYVTHAVWAKDKIGLGTYLRHQHELLLIGRRGNHIARGPLSSSVIHAPRREHSRKPDEAYEIIERMYPELPKIELFARGKREGWAAWGNQADGLDLPESLCRAAP
jgi:N6-adenosine-specific RNA methylase IME4